MLERECPGRNKKQKLHRENPVQEYHQRIRGEFHCKTGGCFRKCCNKNVLAYQRQELHTLLTPLSSRVCNLELAQTSNPSYSHEFKK